ncbi:DUF4145 domain-containing protein [Streptomyces calvus]|jgi:hypothetical protein|nr:DUF4145 domain-containing protein [Streptomyces calvus]MBA8977031.1 hypothetical protein [Streptomyces calvus]MBA8977047.1 hypothetical protein [Streptomyces calvus]
MARRDREGEDILVNCPKCSGPTIARVEATMVHEDFQQLPALYELGRCTKCGVPLLAWEEDFGGGWDGEPMVVWPTSREQRALSPKIPHQLRQAHEEARKCFSVKAYTAAVVMVRRTLEGVCKDQDVQQAGRAPLFQMLKSLKSAGKIDGRLFEWAQALRVLGNEGAHFTEAEVTREDASDSIDLAEALLDYLYVLSAQFDEFKARRGGAQKEETVEASGGSVKEESGA